MHVTIEDLPALALFARVVQLHSFTAAADASGDAAQQLEDAKTIGTTPTELRNLTDAAADASRQNARARAAVDATQGPLQALRQQLR